MSNINRDYLVTLNVKTSEIILSSPMMFFVTDKQTMNIFVKLVVNASDNPFIREYASIENAKDYNVQMVIVSPKGDLYYMNSKLLNEEESLFLLNLENKHTNIVGVWTCELRVCSVVDGEDDIVTSKKFKYTVNPSITTNIENKIRKEVELDIVNSLSQRIDHLEQSILPPIGGKRGQVLVKKSEDDYDVIWTDFETLYKFFIEHLTQILPISEFEQNTMYNKGDQITYNGITYESMIDDNIWRPYVYGWKKINK